MFRLRLFIALLTLSVFGFAQEVQTQFEVVLSKNRLGLNERLRVSFEMNKDGDLFEPPAFDDFEVLMGPSQSTSSSWINGKRSFSRSYTYVLKPKKQGTLRIKPAFITIAGERYATEEKLVEVTADVANPNAPKTAQDVANESLYLVAAISKPNPYENEAVLVTYTLYFSTQVYINNFVPVDSPSYNNFWSQDIPITEYETRRTTYKNELFNAVDLKQVVLYPQKSGDLPIEPFSLELYVQIPTGRRDFFGDPIMRSATKVVSAGSSVLKVKALPNEEKPENFSGAVGDFDFETRANKTSLDANESLQITVKVSGAGNLKLLKLPELNLPSSLEQYEPEFTDEVAVSSAGMKGSVGQTYTVVPRYVGNYPVNSLSFNYFDPEKEQYISLTSAPVTITVENGPVRTSTNTFQPSESMVNSPNALSVQNAFVSNAFTSSFEPIYSKTWVGEIIHVAIILGLILIAILVGLFSKLYQKVKLDSSGPIKKSYQKRSRQLLREAENAASKGDINMFYEALSKTIDHALSLIINKSIHGSSEAQIKSVLNNTAMESSTVQEIADLMNKVNLIKYSPTSSSDVKADVERLKKLIQLIQTKAKSS